MTQKKYLIKPANQRSTLEIIRLTIPKIFSTFVTFERPQMPMKTPIMMDTKTSDTRTHGLSQDGARQCQTLQGQKITQPKRFT